MKKYKIIFLFILFLGVFPSLLHSYRNCKSYGGSFGWIPSQSATLGADFTYFFVCRPFPLLWANAEYKTYLFFNEKETSHFGSITFGYTALSMGYTFRFAGGNEASSKNYLHFYLQLPFPIAQFGRDFLYGAFYYKPMYGFEIKDWYHEIGITIRYLDVSRRRWHPRPRPRPRPTEWQRWAHNQKLYILNQSGYQPWVWTMPQFVNWYGKIVFMVYTYGKAANLKDAQQKAKEISSQTLLIRLQQKLEEDIIAAFSSIKGQKGKLREQILDQIDKFNEKSIPNNFISKSQDVWRRVCSITSRTPLKYSAPYYEYFTRHLIDYENYEFIREQIILLAINKKKLNREEEQIVEELRKRLYKLDDQVFAKR